MKPHLLALNLNGMVKGGDKAGKKILPLGAGDLDLGFSKTIRDSGYTGPIGILGHTQDDAAERLADNLDGLAWLKPQLDGKPVPRSRSTGRTSRERRHDSRARRPRSRLSASRFPSPAAATSVAHRARRPH